GLIQTDAGIKVIEFNARFGDPETQVVLPLLENDLIDVIEAVGSGNDPKLTWREGYAVGAVIASSGYPQVCRKGLFIPELPEMEDGYLIHAGTTFNGYSQLVSDGGRVLLAGSVQKTLFEANSVVYRYLDQFNRQEDFFFRSDVGAV